MTDIIMMIMRIMMKKINMRSTQIIAIFKLKTKNDYQIPMWEKMKISLRRTTII